MKKTYISLLLLALAGGYMTACQRWDDRITVADSALQQDLFTTISAQPNLTRFKDLLVKSGYDKLLRSSQNYTVWAPTDKALAAFDASTLKDSTSLRAFVGNHIALQPYTMPATTTATRLVLLNGKYTTFSKDRFGQVAVSAANQYVANGVLHVIDQYNEVLPNLWEYLTATTAYTQNKLINGLTYLAFNPSKAIVDSISATTGAPIYRKGTGFEPKNRFTDQVFDVKDESKQYTYILLTDDALSAEIKKVTPYFKTSTTDSTYNLSAWQVVKDLAVEGLYTADQLPAALKSKFGVNVPVDKSALVKSVPVSNGMVHIFSKATFALTEKIPTVVVEGESYTSQMQSVASTAIAIRQKFNPLTNQNFQDLSVIAHGVSNFWVGYQAKDLPAAKYKVYWVSLNDQTVNYRTNTLPIVVTQKLAMGNLAATTFANITVPNNTYSEVLLGEYTTTAFGTLNMYLVASGTNSMALDYIKLVPQL